MKLIMTKEGTTSVEDFHSTLISKLGNLKRPPVPSPNSKKKNKEVAKPLPV